MLSTGENDMGLVLVEIPGVPRVCSSYQTLYLLVLLSGVVIHGCSSSCKKIVSGKKSWMLHLGHSQWKFYGHDYLELHKLARLNETPLSQYIVLFIIVS